MPRSARNYLRLAKSLVECIVERVSCGNSRESYSVGAADSGQARELTYYQELLDARRRKPSVGNLLGGQRESSEALVLN
jgi:hypothetical protein